MLIRIFYVFLTVLLATPSVASGEGTAYNTYAFTSQKSDQSIVSILLKCSSKKDCTFEYLESKKLGPEASSYSFPVESFALLKIQHLNDRRKQGSRVRAYLQQALDWQSQRINQIDGELETTEITAKDFNLLFLAIQYDLNAYGEYGSQTNEL